MLSEDLDVIPVISDPHRWAMQLGEAYLAKSTVVDGLGPNPVPRLAAEAEFNDYALANAQPFAAQLLGVDLAAAGASGDYGDLLKALQPVMLYALMYEAIVRDRSEKYSDPLAYPIEKLLSDPPDHIYEVIPLLAAVHRAVAAAKAAVPESLRGSAEEFTLGAVPDRPELVALARSRLWAWRGHYVESSAPHVPQATPSPAEPEKVWSPVEDLDDLALAAEIRTLSSSFIAPPKLSQDGYRIRIHNVAELRAWADGLGLVRLAGSAGEAAATHAVLELSETQQLHDAATTFVEKAGRWLRGPSYGEYMSILQGVRALLDRLENLPDLWESEFLGWNSGVAVDLELPALANELFPVWDSSAEVPFADAFVNACHHWRTSARQVGERLALEGFTSAVTHLENLLTTIDRYSESPADASAGSDATMDVDAFITSGLYLHRQREGRGELNATTRALSAAEVFQQIRSGCVQYLRFSTQGERLLELKQAQAERAATEHNTPASIKRPQEPRDNTLTDVSPALNQHRRPTGHRSSWTRP